MYISNVPLHTTDLKDKWVQWRIPSKVDIRGELFWFYNSAIFHTREKRFLEKNISREVTHSFDLNQFWSYWATYFHPLYQLWIRKGDILRDRNSTIHRNPVCYPRQNNVLYLNSILNISKKCSLSLTLDGIFI